MQIDNSLDDVRGFHQKMRAPISRSPRLLPGNATTAGVISARLHTFADETASVAATSGDMLLAHAVMATEELAEWLTAHERVIHIEYAWQDLPGGLEWHERVTN